MSTLTETHEASRSPQGQVDATKTHTIPEPHSDTIHVRGTVTALTLSERREARAHLAVSSKSPLQAYKSKAEVQVHRKRPRVGNKARGRKGRREADSRERLQQGICSGAGRQEEAWITAAQSRQTLNSKT